MGISLNFSQILNISKLWIAPQIMINRAFILSDVLYKYNYEFTIIINKDKKMEFDIKNPHNKKKRLKIVLLNASWVYISSKKDTLLFNRGNFKLVLDQLGDSNE